MVAKLDENGAASDARWAFDDSVADANGSAGMRGVKSRSQNTRGSGSSEDASTEYADVAGASGTITFDDDVDVDGVSASAASTGSNTADDGDNGNLEENRIDSFGINAEDEDDQVEDDDDIVDEDVDDDLDDDEDDDEDDDDADDDDEYELEVDLDDDRPGSGRRSDFANGAGGYSQAGFSGRSRASKSSVSSKLAAELSGVDIDHEDDVAEYDEAEGDILDLSAGDIDDDLDLLDDAQGTRTDTDADADALLASAEAGLLPNGPDDGDAGELSLAEPAGAGFEDGEIPADIADDDLQTAAESLAGSSLLGLGVDGASRADSSELTSFALGDSDNYGGIATDDEQVMGDQGAPSKKGRSSRQRKTQSPEEGYADVSLFDDAKDVELDDTTGSEASDTSMMKKKKRKGSAKEEPAEDDNVDVPFPDMAIDDDISQGPHNLDAYVDSDEEDEFEGGSVYGVTSGGQFGRVWELNEDTHITITEPGESYPYDLDFVDPEDQDTFTGDRGSVEAAISRARAESKRDIPEGSPEWVARRSYELMLKVPYKDLMIWAKDHGPPPSVIADLHPPEPEAPPVFPPMLLDAKPSDAELGDLTDDADSDDAANNNTLRVTELGNEFARLSETSRKAYTRSYSEEGTSSIGDDESGYEAIERAIKFPCTYRFKVVGGGDGFEESLATDIEEIIGNPISTDAFSREAAGRYQRITIDVPVENARQVTKLYDTIRGNPGTKFSYG